MVEALTRAEREKLHGNLLRDAVGMAQRARRAGVESLIESSGYKGYHVWFFLHQPVEAGLMRKFLGELLRISGPAPEDTHREIFPPSDTRPPPGLQTHIRLPLGVHKLTGERSAWITPEGAVWKNAGPDALDFSLFNRARGLKDAIASWTRFVEPSDASREKPSSRTPDRVSQTLPSKERAPGEQSTTGNSIDKLCRGCPVLAWLMVKAKREGQLSHGDRMVLRGILEPLGPPGVEALHAVMKCCDNYDRKVTNSFLGRPGVKPIACSTIKEVLGDFCEQVGCRCRFKSKKGDYANPLRHLTQPDRTTAKPAPDEVPVGRPEPLSEPLGCAVVGGEGQAVMDLLRLFREQREKLTELTGRIEEEVKKAGGLCVMGRIERDNPDPKLAGWVIRM